MALHAGAEWHGSNWDSRPDCVCTFDDKRRHGWENNWGLVGVETKAPGKIKNTTPNQKRNLEKISKAGGVAIVSDDADRVDLVLNLLTQCGVATYYVP